MVVFNLTPDKAVQVNLRSLQLAPADYKDPKSFYFNKSVPTNHADQPLSKIGLQQMQATFLALLAIIYDVGRLISRLCRNFLIALPATLLALLASLYDVGRLISRIWHNFFTALHYVIMLIPLPVDYRYKWYSYIVYAWINGDESVFKIFERFGLKAYTYRWGGREYIYVFDNSQAFRYEIMCGANPEYLPFIDNAAGSRAIR